MQISPYINFNGNCKEAFEYYQKHLGGSDLLLMTHAESPMHDSVPDAWKDKIIHATLQIGNCSIMGSDSPAEDYAAPTGAYIILSVDTALEAETMFEALFRNGQIRMPLSETFWSVRYGIVVDQFGTPWKINCNKSSNQT